MKAFPEVVTQEGVQNRIDGGVGVAHAGNENVESYVKPAKELISV